jgi:hypothetical protein
MAYRYYSALAKTAAAGLLLALGVIIYFVFRASLQLWFQMLIATVFALLYVGPSIMVWRVSPAQWQQASRLLRAILFGMAFGLLLIPLAIVIPPVLYQLLYAITAMLTGTALMFNHIVWTMLMLLGAIFQQGLCAVALLVWCLRNRQIPNKALLADRERRQ